MFIASNGIKTAVIMRDIDPLHPRTDQDNLGTMVCWHSRYNLGDNHEYRNVQSFAEDLANKHVELKDFFRFILDGRADDVRFADKGDYYQIEARDWPYKADSPWSETEWTVSKDLELMPEHNQAMVKEDLIGSCLYPVELLTLCDESNKVAILPLWLYDHSGLALSTATFLGRAQHAEWDSGQVGFIYMEKDTAIKEMGIPNNEVRLAQRISSGPSVVLQIAPQEAIDSTLASNGYFPVAKEDIVNLDTVKDGSNQPIIDPPEAEAGHLFKKDYKIYRFEGLNSDNTLSIRPVATFNPGISNLTEENWKERALECLEAEVHEYDNYLRGEVYGYQCYEGLDEIDSCWGFNPGKEDILALYDEMFGDWGADLKDAMLAAPYHYGEDFDIEDYFEDHEFPELRDRLMEDVISFIKFEAETSQIYPFAISAAELLSNKSDILDKVVDQLYEDHKEPDSEAIYSAIEEHAGLSRELKPKITAMDLDSNRDYTAEELFALVQKKGSLETMLADAALRQNQLKDHSAASEKNPERS